MLVLVMVVIFTISNRDEVVLSLYPLPFETVMPVYLFFLLTLALGYIWGMMSSGMKTWRYQRQSKREERRNQALEDEVKTLRAQEMTSAAQTESDLPKLSTQ